MKKKLALLLSSVMIVASLTACGSSKAEPSQPSEDGTHAKVVINFPTASASGALYAVGAAITNLWDTEIEFVSASSQASDRKSVG